MAKKKRFFFYVLMNYSGYKKKRDAKSPIYCFFPIVCEVHHGPLPQSEPLTVP